MKDFSIEKYFEQIKAELKHDKKTGVGYCSVTATARLAGVDEKALRYQYSTAEKTNSRLAEMLYQQGFDSRNFSSSGVPDIAVSLTVKYYAWMAGKRCNDHAKAMDVALSAVAIRHLIRSVVGEDARQPQTPEEYLILQMPAIPATWEVRFEKEFWSALKRTYGLIRGQLACASFINWYIYGWFPSILRDRLDEINPILEDGYRENKQHQHFDGVLLEVLRRHIRVVTIALIDSKTKKEFKAAMQAVPKFTFDSSIQQPSGGADNA